MTGFIGVGQLRYSKPSPLFLPPDSSSQETDRRRRVEELVVLCVLTVMIDIVLTNLGEKMSDEEVDELLKAVDTSSGEINYTGISNPSSMANFTANEIRSRPHDPCKLAPSTRQHSSCSVHDYSRDHAGLAFGSWG